jgi:hypothetical protein
VAESRGLARSAQIGKDLSLGGGERTSGLGRAGALFSGVSAVSHAADLSAFP